MYIWKHSNTWTLLSSCSWNYFLGEMNPIQYLIYHYYCFFHQITCKLSFYEIWPSWSSILLHLPSVTLPNVEFHMVRPYFITSNLIAKRTCHLYLDLVRHDTVSSTRWFINLHPMRSYQLFILHCFSSLILPNAEFHMVLH